MKNIKYLYYINAIVAVTLDIVVESLLFIVTFFHINT